ncbi:hypothetical protein FOA52_001535 [Chlamydomonas sp. UWO 241]|nr:hypothetical protein FOA52_001535 [Chlamydomonas sp. UWO 241]
MGVSWDKASWRVRLNGQNIGRYASEEDAARADDCAAVKLRGPEFKGRNFPGEVISEPPVSLGDERKKNKTSLYVGVSFDKIRSAWTAFMWDPQTKHQQYIGSYFSEEDAARAHDWAAVKLRGTGAKRNFPDELITEPPVSRGDEQKERKASRRTL